MSGFPIADCIFAVIMLIFIIVGICKGFLRSVVKMLSGIVSLVLAFLLCKTFASVLNSVFGLNGAFVDFYVKCFKVDDNVMGMTAITDKLATINIPQFVRDLIVNTLESLGISATTTFNSTVPPLLANISVAVISFLILWIIFKIIFAILGKFLKVIDKIPIIRGINKLLGAVLGVVKGAILVFTVLLLVSMFSAVMPQPVIDTINDSTVTKYCYENNWEGEIITYYLKDSKYLKNFFKDDEEKKEEDSTSESTSDSTSDSSEESFVDFSDKGLTFE